MTPSVLFVDSYYSSVLASLGLDRSPRAGTDYESELAALLSFGFGTGSAYQRAFAALGWSSRVVVPNSLTLQTLWAREHGLRDPLASGWQYGAHLSRLPVARDHLHRVRHLHSILLAQVRATRPDVVVVQDLNLIPPGFAKALKSTVRMLVGEIASPLPPKVFLEGYDLIVSALPSIVETAHGMGLDSIGIPLAFDARWASHTPASQRPIDAVFIGSFTRLQPRTAPLLKAVAREVPGLHIYGQATSDVLKESGLADNYHGPAWGSEMFALLAQSKLVVNRHGDVAGPYSVNMRMFETTGSGAALITEASSNLAELFVPGVEALAYTSAQDAADQARELLANPERLDEIAAAGQARTLSDHTYEHRAADLAAALEVRLSTTRA